MATQDTVMKYLGRRIKNARLQAGFTQEHVAEKVGVSRAAITRWEMGEIEPKLRHLVLLAKVLDVSIDHLLGVEIKNRRCEIDLSEEAVTALKRFIREIRKAQET